MVIGLLVAPVSPEDAASIVPEPAVGVTDRSVQVATPATADLVKLLPDVNAFHVAPAFLDKTIEAVESVHTVSDAFSTDTLTVPSVAPTTALRGWDVKTTFVAPHVIVAETGT
jgi:hypothetical protein